MAATLGRDEILSLLAGGALAVPMIAAAVAMLLAVGHVPTITTQAAALVGKAPLPLHAPAPRPTPMAVPRRAHVPAPPHVAGGPQGPAGPHVPAAPAARGLAALRATPDALPGKTWYADPTTPTSDRAGSGIHAYVGQAEGRPPELRLRVRWVTRKGAKPLDLEALHFHVDGRRYAIDNPPYGLLEVRKDLSMTAEQAWEWYDAAADRKRRALLRAIAASKTAVIRYDGRLRQDKHVVTAAEKAAIARVLAAYDSAASGG